MAEFIDQKARIKQNLIDAGCEKDLTIQCIKLYKNNETKKLTNQLIIHRKSLLNNLHQTQYKIDCLDYLLCQLKNK
ncbi:MAG: hypothetical protein RR512_06940 [Coprobacillus sp.]